METLREKYSMTSKSCITRRKIVEAAIQGLSREDLTHKLSFDMITGILPISTATIRYHFGDKDGLMTAIWETIIADRDGHRLSDFYRLHRDMLKTKEGQIEFITRMLEDFASFFQGDKDDWQRRKIRLFFLENLTFPKKPQDHVELYLEDELRTFHTICHEISGVKDRNTTNIWFLFMMHPLAIAYSHLASPRRFGDSAKTRNFETGVLEFSRRLLLNRLGLQDPAV